MAASICGQSFGGQRWYRCCRDGEREDDGLRHPWLGSEVVKNEGLLHYRVTLKSPGRRPGVSRIQCGKPGFVH